MQEKAQRLFPSYLQLVKRERKKAVRIRRKKNGQRSWLRRST